MTKDKTLDKTEKGMKKLGDADCCTVCGMLCKAKNRKKGVFTLNALLRLGLGGYASGALASG